MTINDDNDDASESSSGLEARDEIPRFQELAAMRKLHGYRRAAGTYALTPQAVPPTHAFMRRYELLIFLTGAVTLSLEVLASRIMTPYFGVSLYRSRSPFWPSATISAAR